jgi:hypothetical protein
VLRQTVIALTAGHKPDEHDNPSEDTVHMVHGRVRLAGDVSWERSARRLRCAAHRGQAQLTAVAGLPTDQQ